MRKQVMIVALAATVALSAVAYGAQVRRSRDGRSWAVWSGVPELNGSFRGSMDRRQLRGVFSDDVEVPFALECRRPASRVNGGPVLWRDCQLADLWSSEARWRSVGALMIPAGGGS